MPLTLTFTPPCIREGKSALTFTDRRPNPQIGSWGSPDRANRRSSDCGLVATESSTCDFVICQGGENSVWVEADLPVKAAYQCVGFHDVSIAGSLVCEMRMRGHNARIATARQ